MITFSKLPALFIGLAVGIIFMSQQGCAGFLAPVADKVAKAVEVYCIESYVYRQTYRNTVNAALTVPGHRVHIHCAGDPEPE